VSPTNKLLILCVISYLVGSIPFGLIVGHLRGIDIRLHGSKNIGATNAGRVLGGRFFWIVFLLDLCKGLVPMLFASSIVNSILMNERTMQIHWLWIGVGTLAMLGHVFPIYLKFRGGKGVATSLGIVLGLWPYFTFAGAIVFIIFTLVVLITKYISLGSIISAICFPIVYVLLSYLRGWPVFGPQTPLLIVACLLALLIVARHRMNVRRLLNGSELKVTTRKKESAEVVRTTSHG